MLFSHQRLLTAGEIPSWKEPTVNGTDVTISLTRMEPQPCAVVWAVWMDLIYPRRSWNTAPGDNPELTSHITSLIHPHFTTVSGGPRALEKVQSKSKSNLEHPYTSRSGQRQTHNPLENLPIFSRPFLLLTPEFLLPLRETFHCLALYHMLYFQTDRPQKQTHVGYVQPKPFTGP